LPRPFLGHGPSPAPAPDPGSPGRPWSHVRQPAGKQALLPGGEGTLGRTIRAAPPRRPSFEVAIFSTIGAVSIGVLLGSIAGYYRGWVDTVVSRVTEITMAFPALLFIIALASTVGNRLNDVTLGIFGPGVITLVLVFTIFGWFYPARIIRAVVLSLREKEFVEAARMVGSSDCRIIRSHIMPHLLGRTIVYSTL
jgi:peptide/nickel transport system permease protein